MQFTLQDSSRVRGLNHCRFPFRCCLGSNRWYRKGLCLGCRKTCKSCRCTHSSLGLWSCCWLHTFASISWDLCLQAPRACLHQTLLWTPLLFHLSRSKWSQLLSLHLESSAERTCTDKSSYFGLKLNRRLQSQPPLWSCSASKWWHPMRCLNSPSHLS